MNYKKLGILAKKEENKKTKAMMVRLLKLKWRLKELDVELTPYDSIADLRDNVETELQNLEYVFGRKRGLHCEAKHKEYSYDIGGKVWSCYLKSNSYCSVAQELYDNFCFDCVFSKEEIEIGTLMGKIKGK